MIRQAEIERKTAETDIRLFLSLDGEERNGGNPLWRRFS